MEFDTVRRDATLPMEEVEEADSGDADVGGSSRESPGGMEFIVECFPRFDDFGAPWARGIDGSRVWDLDDHRLTRVIVVGNDDMEVIVIFFLSFVSENVGVDCVRGVLGRTVSISAGTASLGQIFGPLEAGEIGHRSCFWIRNVDLRRIVVDTRLRSPSLLAGEEALGKIGVCSRS